MSKTDANLQTPHDVVIAVSDLKRLTIGLTSCLITLATFFGYNLFNRVGALESRSSHQDVSIASLVQIAEHEKEQRAQMSRLLESAQDGQQRILVQFSELRPKVSAIEEIDRSTQVRLDTLADYLRKNQKSDNAIIDNYDSIRATRP